MSVLGSWMSGELLLVLAMCSRRDFTGVSGKLGELRRPNSGCGSRSWLSRAGGKEADNGPEVLGVMLGVSVRAAVNRDGAEGVALAWRWARGPVGKGLITLDTRWCALEVDAL